MIQKDEADTPNSREAKADMAPRRRFVYHMLGLFFTALGIVGILLPLIPTTFPLILASGFFIHSSPRLHRWLNGNRLTGPYIRAYTEKRGLSVKRKIGTIVLLWFGLGISAWLLRDTIWALALLGAVGIGVSIHVATIRPERPLAEPDEAAVSDAQLVAATIEEAESVEEDLRA
jgi:uncharacterized membrane protein YbaN (DUF454 family)